MRRKLGALILASCMLCTNVVTTKAETLLMDGQTIEYNLPAISLYVNNKKVETKVMDPIQLDGRVLVPTREVFEAMGAKVTWDNTLKKVTVQYKGNTIVLIINQSVATINGKEVTMDVPGKIINNKVMIPIRFVSEGMGFSVNWDQTSRSVNINEKVSELPSQQITGQTYKGGTNNNNFLIPAGTYATTSIQKVEVSETGNVMKAVITAQTPISEANISTMTGKLVVDIKNSKNKLSSQMTPGTNTYVKNIRTSQFTADTTRVVFDLKSGAQINASLSNDRTKIMLEFTVQNLEQISISSTQSTDKIYFKGLGTDQILIAEGKESETLQFILPNVNMKESVAWTGISSLFIEKITMNQVGNDVQGTIRLKQSVTHSFQSQTYGTNLVLKGTATEDDTPTEDEEEQKPEEKPEKPQENPTQGLVYTAGNRPQLTLSNVTGLSTSQIKVTDDYRNKKLIFDLGANYSTILKTSTLTINDGSLKSINISHTGTTKITIDTQKIYTYNISQSGNQVTLELIRPSQKFNQIVVLDIGHGGSDSGTIGNGLKEKDVNLNQGMALYHLLEADPNIKVYMTRETDVYPTLQFRATLANEIEADLFVSIHNNSTTTPTVQGAETLYFPSTTDTRGKAIAQLVQNSLVNDSGMLNRGIKARSDLHVLNSTHMPAILIETGFLSNASDASRINTTSFINTWAKGVYNAIVQGFKLL